jgi:hypothetical protein
MLVVTFAKYQPGLDRCLSNLSSQRRPLATSSRSFDRSFYDVEVPGVFRPTGTGVICPMVSQEASSMPRLVFKIINQNHQSERLMFLRSCLVALMSYKYSTILRIFFSFSSPPLYLMTSPKRENSMKYVLASSSSL